MSTEEEMLTKEEARGKEEKQKVTSEGKGHSLQITNSESNIRHE